MADKEYATIDFDSVLHETTNAVLIEIDGEEKWIPRSVIDDIDYDRRSAEVETWFAEKEGLV